MKFFDKLKQKRESQYKVIEQAPAPNIEEINIPEEKSKATPTISKQIIKKMKKLLSELEESL